jgi:hypothetical protein|nr:MAG TPA: hypothetical protein [Bacteriophage sp.]
MKAHIRKEKKTTPLNLGKGMLLQDEDGNIYKVCDTEEYDEMYTDDEDVIKVELSEDNMIPKAKPGWFCGLGDLYGIQNN